jgi:plastocyanin
MSLMRRIPIVAAALLLLVAAAGCGGYGNDKGEQSEEGTPTTIAGMETEIHGTKDVSGETGKVKVELYDNFFEPTVLKGTPAQKQAIELENEGEAAHTFTIAEQNVDQQVEPGDEAEVEVTFPESGTLTFVCTFHESGGMVGELQASS